MGRGLAYQNKGDNDKAVVEFTEAIRLAPDSAEAFQKRGLAYEKKGEKAKAEADFAEAKRLEAAKAVTKQYPGEDPIMSTEWYYHDGSQVHGPLSPRQLADLAARGSLRPDYRVRKGSEGIWHLASQSRYLLLQRPCSPSPVSRRQKHLRHPCLRVRVDGPFQWAVGS